MYFSTQQAHTNVQLSQDNDSFTVKTLDNQSQASWDCFVLKNSAHPFHLSCWAEIISNCFDYPLHYLYAERNGKIEAVLPLVEVKSFLFGHALISVPFLVYGGPLGSKQAIAKLLEYAKDLGTELGVDYIDLKCDTPSVEEGWTQNIYYNFEREISTDPEQNLKDIPRKQRAIVRKSLQNGLEAKFEENIDNFYLLYAESVRNLGTPVMSKKFYQTIKNTLGNQCWVMTVFKGKQAIASVMSYHHGNTILPYYAGGADAARRYKAHDFMYWALMQQAQTVGCDKFNFGRSKIDTGAYSFKKHWGFEPKLLPYRTIPIQATAAPNLNPTNPKYQLMIKLWKKLPLKVSTVIGPVVARRLG